MTFRSPAKLLCALTLALASVAASAQQTFPIVILNIGMYQLTAEVVKTEADREQGLMNRTSLAPNSGMIFDFERPAQKVCMWMKNTLIPLSVAFIDNDGVIINVDEMEPNTLTNHCGTEGKPVRYALEMNKGWFNQRHIGPGSKILNTSAQAKDAPAPK